QKIGEKPGNQQVVGTGQIVVPCFASDGAQMSKRWLATRLENSKNFEPTDAQPQSTLRRPLCDLSICCIGQQFSAIFNSFEIKTPRI
ncbi:MAG: hypothetical protein AAFO94_22545, partial [Bacteroidota bacterium]